MKNHFVSVIRTDRLVLFTKQSLFIVRDIEQLGRLCGQRAEHFIAGVHRYSTQSRSVLVILGARRVS
jgi:hypothetical protein